MNNADMERMINQMANVAKRTLKGKEIKEAIAMRDTTARDQDGHIPVYLKDHRKTFSQMELDELDYELGPYYNATMEDYRDDYSYPIELDWAVPTARALELV